MYLHRKYDFYSSIGLTLTNLIGIWLKISLVEKSGSKKAKNESKLVDLIFHVTLGAFDSFYRPITFLSFLDQKRPHFG